VLLAGWAAGACEEARAKRTALILAVLLSAGCLLEVAHGVQAVRVYPDRAWIRPLIAGWSP